MRRRPLVSVIACALASTVGAGCEAGSEDDPLDVERVRELARDQGSANTDAHTGYHTLLLSMASCDCPRIEYQGQTLDLCTIQTIGAVTAELGEADGMLAMSTPLGLFTGAIEQDGSFVVAGITDLSTLAGPLEWVRRFDGEFASDGSAEGWAGQRLIGELPDRRIDCRWIGSFALTPN